MRIHILIASCLLLASGPAFCESPTPQRRGTTPTGNQTVRNGPSDFEIAQANNQFSNEKTRRQDALTQEREARFQERKAQWDSLKVNPPTTKLSRKPLITFVLASESEVRLGSAQADEYTALSANDLSSLDGVITTSLAANTMFGSVLTQLDKWVPENSSGLQLNLPVFSEDQAKRAGEGKQEYSFPITPNSEEYKVAEELANEFVGMVTRPAARSLGAMAVKGDPTEEPQAAPAPVQPPPQPSGLFSFFSPPAPVAPPPTPPPAAVPNTQEGLEGHYQLKPETAKEPALQTGRSREELKIANAEAKKIFNDFRELLQKDKSEFDRKQEALDSEKAPGQGGGDQQQQAQETPPETPPGGAPPGGQQGQPSQAKAPLPAASQTGISSMGVGGQAPNDVVSGIGSLGSYLASQLAPFLNKDPHPTSSVKLAGTPNNSAQPPGEVEKTSAGERRALGNSSPGSGIAGGAPSNNANDAAGAPAPNGLAGIGGAGNGGGGGGFPEGINGGDYGGSDGKPNSAIDVAYASGGTVDGGGEPSINKANPAGDFVGGGVGGLFAQLAPQRLVGNVVSNVKAGLVQAMHGQWAAKHCGDSKYSDDSFCLVAKTKTRLSPPSRMPASLTKKQGELGA